MQAKIPLNVSAPQTATSIENANGALQAIVDAGEAASAELRRQRDSLQAQLADINVQITAAEGKDVATARKTIQILNNLKNLLTGM